METPSALDMNTQDKERLDRIRFFCQYWGQDVMVLSNGMTVHFTEMYFQEMGSIQGDHYLKLKPLSSIKVNEIIEVGKLVEGKGSVEGYIEDHGKDSYQKYFLEFLVGSSPETVDILRSKGYLLPFGNYTTDQIKEMGWAKEIES